MEGMVESGTGGEKRKGSASTPREVPSNFSAVVAPMSTSRISHFCIWGLRRYSARYNRSFNRCVARVCCKSARHWLTLPPTNSTQTTDGRGVGQLLCFGCMLAITAHDVIAYITVDDRPNISSASSRLRTARPTQWRNYNLWASRQTFATCPSPPLNL